MVFLPVFITDRIYCDQYLWCLSNCLTLEKKKTYNDDMT